MSFWNDDSGRVPFAVVGIFLIIISTIVSLNLARLDIDMAKALTSGSEIAAADTTLLYARADLARAINYAGMDALKKLGENPVIIPDNTSEYLTNGDPIEFNRNRARAMINNTLNQYIESNYMNDTFVNNEFSVNIDYLGSWEDIKIEIIKMRLAERLEPPLFAPGGGKYQKGYETYWKISVPLKVHLKNLGTKSELISENITIETVITSRYPLLAELTEEYGERLNGTNAVMAQTTAFATAYTWAGGYLQYYENTPLNIVNNTHLALITNGALLLDQGFVFNSVDPMSIAEYANQTANTLSGASRGYHDISLENGSLRINPQEDAFNSTGDPLRAKEDFNTATRFDYNATSITDYLTTDSMPGGSIAAAMIQRIIQQVYATTLATSVTRETEETLGSHIGYDSSYRIEDWGEPDSMRFLEELPNETSVPGNLFGEKWEVTWTRGHTWRHYYVVSYTCGKSTCYRTKYHEMTATDTRVDVVTITLRAVENSNTHVLLNFAGIELASMNDVLQPYTPVDVYYGSSHTDTNLEGAYLRYKRDVFDPDKMDNIKNRDLNGVCCQGTYSSGAPEPYSIEAQDWVSREAWFAIEEIREAIKNDVHLDPGINYATYPVPSDLLVAARDDLIFKIERNESRYANRTDYITSNNYMSASAKVISLAREWYVDEVKYQIRDKFTNGSSLINDRIDENFTGTVPGASRNATRFLSRELYLPLGLRMKAYHVDGNGNAYAEGNLSAWNENVTLSVDQEPNYLDEKNPHPSNPRLYTLKVRNNNLLGGSGIHVLPTLEPWLMTFNMWSIDVEGEFVKFEVRDIDNEAHPDPIFGHEPQVYVREEDAIDDQLTQLRIGENRPIKFTFTTGTFIAVPPGKLTGVGDKDWIIIEESAGYQ